MRVFQTDGGYLVVERDGTVTGAALQDDQVYTWPIGNTHWGIQLEGEELGWGQAPEPLWDHFKEKVSV